MENKAQIYSKVSRNQQRLLLCTAVHTQAGKTKLEHGNYLANKAAKEAAEKGTRENIFNSPARDISLSRKIRV